ncbi:hypothetical protein MNBD_PLANCTO02-2260, partial [hydrothermal vent metagenome]
MEPHHRAELWVNSGTLIIAECLSINVVDSTTAGIAQSAVSTVTVGTVDFREVRKALYGDAVEKNNNSFLFGVGQSAFSAALVFAGGSGAAKLLNPATLKKLGLTLLAGGTALAVYGRSQDPNTNGAGQVITGAFYDLTGVTGIYKGITKIDPVTGVEYEMTDAERGRSTTNGVFQFAMILFGLSKSVKVQTKTLTEVPNPFTPEIATSAGNFRP